MPIHIKLNKMVYKHPHRLNITTLCQGGEVLEEHCTIELHDGVATLEAKPDAQCWVNSQFVDKPSRLTQGQYQMPIMLLFPSMCQFPFVCPFSCDGLVPYGLV